MFQLDKIAHLRSALKNKGSQIKQNGIPILIGMQSLQKSLRFQNSFIERFISEG